MIKVGDTFKAGLETYGLTKINKQADVYTFQDSEGDYFISIFYDNRDSKLSYANKHLYLDADEIPLNYHEMRMCIEIIDKLKGENHDTK